MVSNNKKVCTISECYVLLQLSNNINEHSPWMLSLEIFGSACAAAADYRQIRYRPSIPAAGSKDLKPNIITLHNSLQVRVKFSVRKKVFIYFIFLHILKTNGTELIDESANVCLHFSGHVTSQAFERVLSFCWSSRCLYFL